MAQKTKKTTAPRRAAAKTLQTPVKAAKPKTKKTVKKPVKTAAAQSKTAVKPQAEAMAQTAFLPNIPNPNDTMETIMAQSKTQYDAFVKDANELGREGLDAFVKSSTIFAKGFEDIFRTSMDLAQAAAEKQTKLMKDAMSSKTLNEWTEVQNKIAKSNFDDFMAGATKISELSVKVLSEASEPINEQVAKGVSKATKAA